MTNSYNILKAAFITVWFILLNTIQEVDWSIVQILWHPSKYDLTFPRQVYVADQAELVARRLQLPWNYPHVSRLLFHLQTAGSDIDSLFKQNLPVMSLNRCTHMITDNPSFVLSCATYPLSQFFQHRVYLTVLLSGIKVKEFFLIPLISVEDLNWQIFRFLQRAGQKHLMLAERPKPLKKKKNLEYNTTYKNPTPPTLSAILWDNPKSNKRVCHFQHIHIHLTDVYFSCARMYKLSAHTHLHYTTFAFSSLFLHQTFKLSLQFWL